jgi:hypothetical protein
MVATETWVRWWWTRCQAMVSGPASRPAAVSLPRSSVISVTVAGGSPSGWSWAARAGLERGLALGAVASDQAADPALVDAVSAGDLALGAAFDDDGGDDEACLGHPRTVLVW